MQKTIDTSKSIWQTDECHTTSYSHILVFFYCRLYYRTVYCFRFSHLLSIMPNTMSWLLGEKANTNTFAYTATYTPFTIAPCIMRVWNRYSHFCFIVLYAHIWLGLCGLLAFPSSSSHLHTKKRNGQFDVNYAKFVGFILTPKKIRLIYMTHEVSIVLQRNCLNFSANSSFSPKAIKKIGEFVTTFRQNLEKTVNLLTSEDKYNKFTIIDNKFIIYFFCVQSVVCMIRLHLNSWWNIPFFWYMVRSRAKLEIRIWIKLELKLTLEAINEFKRQLYHGNKKTPISCWNWISFL